MAAFGAIGLNFRNTTTAQFPHFSVNLLSVTEFATMDPFLLVFKPLVKRDHFFVVKPGSLSKVNAFQPISNEFPCDARKFHIEVDPRFWTTRPGGFC